MIVVLPAYSIIGKVLTIAASETGLILTGIVSKRLNCRYSDQILFTSEGDI